MNRLLFLLFIGCAILTATISRGQDIPISHEISFPKGDTAWSVTFSKSGTNASQNAKKTESKNEDDKPKPSEPERFQKIEIVRTGDIRRDMITWMSGASAEFWWSNKLGVVVWKKDAEPVRAMRSGYFESQRFDQSSFSWVDKSTYKGNKALGKTLYQYYRMEVVDSFGTITIYQAWIDPVTHRPAALLVGEGQPGIFTYDLPLPREPLAFSGEFSAKLNEVAQALVPRKSYGR